MSNVVDIDDLSTDMRAVPYDRAFAEAQMKKITDHEHTEDTMAALMHAALKRAAPPPSASHPELHPPEWKGCKSSFYCIRPCGPNGNHLQADGSPGGRGACALRRPPAYYCPPAGHPAFEEAVLLKKKRKREGSPSHGVWSEENAATQDVVHQAAAAQSSEMETIRTAVERLQQENARLSREVNSLDEWKASMFAAFMPPGR